MCEDGTPHAPLDPPSLCNPRRNREGELPLRSPLRILPSVVGKEEERMSHRQDKLYMSKVKQWERRCLMYGPRGLEISEGEAKRLQVLSSLKKRADILTFKPFSILKG